MWWNSTYSSRIVSISSCRTVTTAESCTTPLLSVTGATTSNASAF
jgi:hypothetical protein